MNKIIITSLVIGLFLASNANAQMTPAKKLPITITTASYQLKIVRNNKGKVLKDKKGKPIKKWQKATKVVPDTIVKYVDTASNSSDKPLSRVTIQNPINKHLEYIANSAKAEKNATITYSVDGGKHFDMPKNLYVVNKKGKKHLAQPKEYNAIKWVISEVPANGSVKVEFKAKLK